MSRDNRHAEQSRGGRRPAKERNQGSSLVESQITIQQPTIEMMPALIAMRGL